MSKVWFDLDMAGCVRERYALAALCMNATVDDAVAVLYDNPLIRIACRFGNERQARLCVLSALRGRCAFIWFAGNAHTFAEWRERRGIHETTLYDRLRQGWPVGRALGYYTKGKAEQMERRHRARATAKRCKRRVKVATCPSGNARCT